MDYYYLSNTACTLVSEVKSSSHSNDKRRLIVGLFDVECVSMSACVCVAIIDVPHVCCYFLMQAHVPCVFL